MGTTKEEAQRTMRELLIDGNHLAARSHFAMNELAKSDGHKSGAIHGFLMGFSWVVNHLRLSQSQAIVAWDGGRSAWRMNICPEYKAGRSFNTDDDPQAVKDREDYVRQLRAIQTALGHLGVRQVRVSGMEADDIISVVAYSTDNLSVVYSGDADFDHIVSDKTVGLLKPKKNNDTVLFRKDVLELYGLPTMEDVLLYKVLVGDQSDNIGKMRGCGDKTAKRIIQEVWGKPRSTAFQKKWGDKIEEHIALLTRNFNLMALPRSWDQSFYAPSQVREAEAQLYAQQTPSKAEFMRLLMAWELDDVLRRIERW